MVKVNVVYLSYEGNIVRTEVEVSDNWTEEEAFGKALDEDWSNQIFKLITVE